ncbi:tyrosine-type recombinase/integrase [Cellulosilyticum lentocellum]|uniref:Integrase family protein n=1 Tax=Cellulosilyticum lentocellum (strain ATCC 49066 / DSM 5427 / NCIMB 11756 / RHM5) TaxID=642492 RepID=F2JIA2_CELLD|nr:site-specific integrase [Cellulosilyticum lentocellum]ADZ83130.1 integrase family protein [Cellulosilyticum lentocellum DSM 5427]
MATYFKRTYKRKDGTTYVRWVGESNLDSYKPKTVYGKSKKECEDKIRDYESDFIKYGTRLVKKRITLSDLMYDHLFTNTKASVSLGTFERYMSLYNTHIKDSALGKRDIQKILQRDVQQFFNSKTELSSKSLSMLKYLLNQSFDHGIANQFIRINPMKKITLPKSTYVEKEIEVLTHEEQKAFMGVVNESFYKMLFTVALHTGMRVGEIMALKWHNVDLIDHMIHVKESSRLVKEYDSEGNGEDKVITKSPKTKAGIRDIPIHPSLSEELTAYKAEHNGQDDDYVFKNSKGNQIKYDSIAKAHKLLCEKAKIRPYTEIGSNGESIIKYKGITFHGIRHSFATRLIEQGVDVKTVSQLLGHTDVKITLNRYVHSTDDTKKDAIHKLQKALSAL